MNDRASLLPSPEFEKLTSLLSDRIMRTASSLNAENFDDFLDPTMKNLLQRAFQNAGAHEGAVWLVDPEGKNLVVCHAWGTRAAQVTGFAQPLTSGIVSMVLATEQPFCENKVYTNRMQAKALDQKLGVLTCSMIAAPLTFAKGLRGVVSCIKAKQLAEEPDPPGFEMAALGEMQFVAHVLGKLIEFELVSVITGWDNGL
ncbi:MAG: GAF domain-containing protein [Verrucomicrobiaceae bacterium]|nr:GAF domain-containing protein [Verrucomicrobiaceae bacterium]